MLNRNSPVTRRPHHARDPCSVFPSSLPSIDIRRLHRLRLGVACVRARARLETGQRNRGDSYPIKKENASLQIKREPRDARATQPGVSRRAVSRARAAVRSLARSFSLREGERRPSRRLEDARCLHRRPCATAANEDALTVCPKSPRRRAGGDGGGGGSRSAETRVSTRGRRRIIRKPAVGGASCLSG